MLRSAMGVQRLFASTLIGRAAELAEIREVLLPGPSGRPGALLISGEAGVGKTRLIREARREAPFDSWTNIETFALPDQGAPAYFATARIVARVARLATVDPALVHEVEAALQGTDASSSTVLPPPDEGRFRLLDAMVRLIESAARDKPILITFDDMQWASAADWSVAGHLIRTADAPLALVIAAGDERLGHAEGAAPPVEQGETEHALRVECQVEHRTCLGNWYDNDGRGIMTWRFGTDFASFTGSYEGERRGAAVGSRTWHGTLIKR